MHNFIYCRPIHDAIEVGAFELVKLLIRYGADPLAEQGEKTPAEFALDMEQPEIHAYLQCKNCIVCIRYPESHFAPT